MWASSNEADNTGVTDRLGAANVNYEIWRKEVDESRQRNNKIMVMKWRTSALAAVVRAKVALSSVGYSPYLPRGCVGSAD